MTIVVILAAMVLGANPKSYFYRRIDQSLCNETKHFFPNNTEINVYINVDLQFVFKNDEKPNIISLGAVLKKRKEESFISNKILSKTNIIIFIVNLLKYILYTHNENDIKFL